MSKTKDIYEEGESWFEDQISSLRKREKLWAIVAIVSLFITLVSVIALAGLTPLKTTEPFVVEVNSTSGESRILKQYTGNVEKLSIEEVLSKYWINQYLISRESFFPKLDLDENYEKVRTLSEGKAFKNYSNRFTDGHPENPFSKYGANQVQVRVISISFLRGDTATVRYELIETSVDKETRTQWIDILNYSYTKTPTSESAKLKNPLGFKISNYRSDREVVN